MAWHQRGKPKIEHPRRELEHMIMYTLKDEYFKQWVLIDSTFSVDRGRMLRAEIERALPSDELERVRKALDKLSLVIYEREKPRIIIFADPDNAPPSLIKQCDRLAGMLKTWKPDIQHCFFVATTKKPPKRIPPTKNLTGVYVGSSFDDVWSQLKQFFDEYFKPYMREVRKAEEEEEEEAEELEL